MSFISLCVAAAVVGGRSFIRSDDVDDDDAAGAGGASDDAALLLLVVVVAVIIFYFFVVVVVYILTFFVLLESLSKMMLSFRCSLFILVYAVSRFLFYISVVDDSIECKTEITVVVYTFGCCCCFFFCLLSRTCITSRTFTFWCTQRDKKWLFSREERTKDRASESGRQKKKRENIHNKIKTVSKTNLSLSKNVHTTDEKKKCSLFFRWYLWHNIAHTRFDTRTQIHTHRHCREQ